MNRVSLSRELEDIFQYVYRSTWPQPAHVLKVIANRTHVDLSNVSKCPFQRSYVSTCRYIYFHICSRLSFPPHVTVGAIGNHSNAPYYRALSSPPPDPSLFDKLMPPIADDLHVIARGIRQAALPTSPPPFPTTPKNPKGATQ